jgi:enoyl-[acyl-carrier protein] reductase I
MNAGDDPHMLNIDLRGKRAFVAGVADDGGFGFAIAKAMAEAGATICLGTWPPALGIFNTMLARGKFDASLVLSDGSKLAFEKVYPLDAEYDRLEDVPADVKESRRYRECGDFTIHGVAAQVKADFGEGGVDIVVHSLANGPEVKKPLLETSRKGYLAAVSASAYSMTSMVAAFAPIMKRGGAFVSLTYMASERVVPGYGGGMSSAKAALESDTRTLAYEAGRAWGHRVNTISAGAYASRAASAIGFIDQMIDYTTRNAPLTTPITAADVGATAAFLCSPLGAGITGTTMYVDKGYSIMGVAVDREGALNPPNP